MSVRTRAIDTTPGTTEASAVTYGGTSLSLLHRYQTVPSGAAETFNLEVWELRNPPSGTATVSVSFPVTIFRGYLSATDLANVDQVSPLITTSNASGVSTDTAAQASVTATASGQCAFFLVYTGANAATVTGGATSQDVTNIGEDITGVATRIASSASDQTATWNHTGGVQNTWISTALLIRESGFSTQTIRPDATVSNTNWTTNTTTLDGDTADDVDATIMQASVTDADAILGFADPSPSLSSLTAASVVIRWTGTPILS